MITYPIDMLVSYHYFDDDDMADIAAAGGFNVIGDCGAYSAASQGITIDLADYAAWVARWRPHLTWAAALDVIGDPIATHRNWATLRDEHGLDTVPTVHFGTDPAHLDVYGTAGCDFIGLGGLVGRTPQAVMPWLVAMFKRARDRWPALRFHGWGITKYDICARLPFYSVDSSGVVGSAYRYAVARLWNPRTASTVTVALDGRDVYRHARLLRETYGINPADITRSHTGNQHLILHLMVASTQTYAAWLADRWNIPPPAAAATARQGTCVHIAEGSPSNLRKIITYLVKEQPA